MVCTSQQHTVNLKESEGLVVVEMLFDYLKEKIEAVVNPSLYRPQPGESASLTLHTKPPLATILNSHDFAEVASKTLTPKTWAFYSSAATDLITNNANASTFSRIWFRPRVLRDVKTVSTKTCLLGSEVKLPIFVSPAALAKLVHPEGEKAIARACVKSGIAQCISANASYSATEIVDAGRDPDHPFWFQLYVNKDRSKSEQILRSVEDAGCRAVFVTVDAPVVGKREADERVDFDDGSVYSGASGSTAKKDQKGGGIGRTTGAYIDSTLSWDDLRWLRSCTKLKIVLKGIQTAADAMLAADHGVDGIVLSNHGGRSLDTSPPAVMVLLELNKLCPQIFTKIEILIDGGIRRGTDVLKCLCLGAKAVGMGRSFLYAVNYGQEGVEHLVDLMKDELEVSMQMLGITSLDQVHRGLVNTLDLDHLIAKDFGELSPMNCKSKL